MGKLHRILLELYALQQRKPESSTHSRVIGIDVPPEFAEDALFILKEPSGHPDTKDSYEGTKRHRQSKKHKRRMQKYHKK